MNRLPPSRANSGSTETGTRAAGRLYRVRKRRGERAFTRLAVVRRCDDRGRDRCARGAPRRFLRGVSRCTVAWKRGRVIVRRTARLRGYCAPPGSHAALIERALQSGLHVLCEKPLFSRLSDARPVAAASASAGRIVHTVHNWLKAPICLKISALIEKRRDRTCTVHPLADVAHAAGRRRGARRRHKLARRSGDSGRRHPVRSRLARALLPRALDRSSPRHRCDARKAPLSGMAARRYRNDRA